MFNSDEELIQNNKDNIGSLINNIQGNEVFLKLNNYLISNYQFKYSIDPTADLNKNELEKEIYINLNLKK